MLNFNSLLLFSDNPKKLSEFYKKVFQKDPDWTEGEYAGFQVGSAHFMVGPHDKVHGKNQTPERVLVNLQTTDVEGEFTRIKELGATVVAKPYHPSEDKKAMLATFADPDGNYFQLASPFEM